MNDKIINGLLSFSLITVIFLAILYISFLLFSKKFKFNKKYIDLYGLFLNLKTTSLIAISSYTINYLFLIWLLVRFDKLGIVYISISIILSLVGNIVMDDFRGILKNLLIAFSNFIAIEFVYMIYNYLINEYRSLILIIILFLVVIFVFMYFTYNLLKSINNVIVNNVSSKRRKFKL